MRGSLYSRGASFLTLIHPFFNWEGDAQASVLSEREIHSFFCCYSLIHVSEDKKCLPVGKLCSHFFWVADFGRRIKSLFQRTTFVHVCIILIFELPFWLCFPELRILTCNKQVIFFKLIKTHCLIFFVCLLIAVVHRSLRCALKL